MTVVILTAVFVGGMAVGAAITVIILFLMDK